MDAPPPVAASVHVRRVIDGDTIELREVGADGHYERVRLSRITAPELGARSSALRGRAYSARDRLRALSVGVEVVIVRESLDKYGRTIARLWARDARGEWRDVEEVLVDEGLVEWWQDFERRQRRSSREPSKMV